MNSDFFRINYVTGATWNTGNGVLTLNRQNGSVSVDLDNRYALISNSFSGNYNDLFNKPWENLSGILYTDDSLWVGSLAGSGTRMMVVNSNGFVSTQAIPSGGSADGNNYVTGMTFNTSTGVLTLSRQNGTVTQDLDGRYALAGSGGGVSGTAGYIPVFDSSTDGVGNSVIQQNVPGYGLVFDERNFKIGNTSTTRIFVADDTGVEYGLLSFGHATQPYMSWSRQLQAQQGLVLSNMATAPAADSNGCVLFSQDGVLKVRNSNGSIVTLS